MFYCILLHYVSLYITDLDPGRVTIPVVVENPITSMAWLVKAIKYKTKYKIKCKIKYPLTLQVTDKGNT